MSYLNESGALHPFEEVVPDAAKVVGLSRSSILTGRRRAKVSPQSGQNYGSAGANGGAAQIQVLIADAGGLVDMRSICFNYFLQTSGSGAVADDGHVFTTVQILLNGQLLENMQNAMKVSNIETKLGASKSYYETAGSFQGFELLNGNLNASTGLAKWGVVTANTVDINARQTKAASPQTNGYVGSPRSIPLSAISGLGRMKQYLPISLLGELQFVLITGNASDVVFNPTTSQNTGATASDFSISGFNVTYDVVIPDPRYSAVLQKLAVDASEGGLMMPFESTICTSGAAVAASVTALSETSIIVSRATSHLLRTSLVLIPTLATSSSAWPSQSCFSHAGVWSYQNRIGSQTYPQIPAQGDADMFNLALEAYGSVSQENGTCVNRQLWGTSTSLTANNTSNAVYETPAVACSATPTATTAGGGAAQFGFADSFIPSYGFRTVKGNADKLDVDGINLSAASGSQLITTILAAPPIAYTPYITLTALKFITARGGAVSVAGA